MGRTIGRKLACRALVRHLRSRRKPGREAREGRAMGLEVGVYVLTFVLKYRTNVRK